MKVLSAYDAIRERLRWY